MVYKIPKVHDIRLYLKMKGFREGYESIPVEERCADYDELFMSVYDQVVKTWRNGTKEIYNKPLMVTESMPLFVKRRYGFYTGQEFRNSKEVMKWSDKIKNLSSICHWVSKGHMKYLV